MDTRDDSPAEPADGCTGTPWCSCWDCDRQHRMPLPRRQPTRQPTMSEVA